MRVWIALAACAVAAVLLPPAAVAGDRGNSGEAVEIVRNDDQYSRASIQPARFGNRLGIAVVFQGTDDLHFYASDKTAHPTVPAAIQRYGRR